MDKAGNSASTSIMHVNVDVTAPTINLINPGISGSYLLNQSANASYGCSDSGSSGLVAGSAGCGGPVASGSQFDTASVGSKNFTVNARDVAGNTASQTNTYGVFYSTGSLAVVLTVPAIIWTIRKSVTTPAEPIEVPLASQTDRKSV